jgi:2-iminobutanoate/2-iminopropanoate deaminase
MKKAINTNKAPLPVGPYNQAVLVDKTLYISGQVALNPENNELIQGSIEDETNQIMKNIKSILNEAGLDFNNVVRSKIYLTDMNNFSKVNQVYGSYFEKNHEPARTTLEVSGLPLGADVEIDMIAVSID